METIHLNKSQWLAISNLIIKLKEQQLLQELQDSLEIEDFEIKELSIIRLREKLSDLYKKNGSLILSNNSCNILSRG